jgi:S1-C subfamily serine protease
MPRFRARLIALLLLVVGLVNPVRVAAQVDPIVLGRAIEATVQLSIVVNGSIDGEQQVIWYAVGSGTIVSPDGLILTNQHLITPAGVGEKLAELEAQLAAEGKAAELEVDPERFMVAVSDGRHLPDPRYVAWVAASDPDLDLAVLRIDGDERGGPLGDAPLNLPAMAIGNSDALNLGDPVHVFGFPAIGSGSLTYTAGIVSGFLFEEEIDGTAWINTDAVTSGGNSGGSAVNDSGELIGIPTSGSALDCRAGDTNRDGAIGPEDVGCVPTGGSLTQLRPIDLAKRVLASVDAAVTGEVGSGAAVNLTPEADTLSTSIAAAEGCATRGDWRCAANFYLEALANDPDDPGLVASLYDAYLSLGQQEAAAGRLGSARSAFSSAITTDPGRADAPVALDRIAPYRRALTIDSFDGHRNFKEAPEGEASSAYVDGQFRIEITRPGLVSGYPLTQDPIAGENVAALLRIAEATGDGMVTIETRTDPAGGQWVFAVDPGNRTWEVLQFDAANGQFMPWESPFFYGEAAGEVLQSIELRISDGLPRLFVNGLDVSAMASAPLPNIGNEGEISFGALMASEGSEPFRVAFAEVALYELE